MNREMIERIQVALAHPYMSLKLRADGHDLTAAVRRISDKSISFGVVLFVNGYIEGKHLKVDSEIGAKFYPLRTRNLLTRKERASYQRQFGKRKLRELEERVSYQYRQAHFRSGRALAMHLKKHCTEVEIIAPDTTPEKA